MAKGYDFINDLTDVGINFLLLPVNPKGGKPVPDSFLLKKLTDNFLVVNKKENTLSRLDYYLSRRIDRETVNTLLTYLKNDTKNLIVVTYPYYRSKEQFRFYFKEALRELRNAVRTLQEGMLKTFVISNLKLFIPVSFPDNSGISKEEVLNLAKENSYSAFPFKEVVIFDGDTLYSRDSAVPFWLDQKPYLKAVLQRIDSLEPLTDEEYEDFKERFKRADFDESFLVSVLIADRMGGVGKLEFRKDKEVLSVLKSVGELTVDESNPEVALSQRKGFIYVKDGKVETTANFRVKGKSGEVYRKGMTALADLALSLPDSVLFGFEKNGKSIVYFPVKKSLSDKIVEESKKVRKRLDQIAEKLVGKGKMLSQRDLKFLKDYQAGEALAFLVAEELELNLEENPGLGEIKIKFVDSPEKAKALQKALNFSDTRGAVAVKNFTTTLIIFSDKVRKALEREKNLSAEKDLSSPEV